jgi:antitoxin VapB
MALTIENPETEWLASEVAELAGESPAEAVRRALEERKQRLEPHQVPSDRVTRLRRFLEREVWVHLPPDSRGKPLSKQEREAILGYGPGGV